MITRKGFIQAVIALFVAPKTVKAKELKTTNNVSIPEYKKWGIEEELDNTPIVASTAEPTDDIIFIDDVILINKAIVPNSKGITLYRNDYTGEVIGVPANGWFYHGFKDVIRGWGGSGSSYMAVGDPLVFIGYACLEK